GSRSTSGCSAGRTRGGTAGTAPARSRRSSTRASRSTACSGSTTRSRSGRCTSCRCAGFGCPRTSRSWASTTSRTPASRPRRSRRSTRGAARSPRRRSSCCAAGSTHGSARAPSPSCTVRPCGWSSARARARVPADGARTARVGAGRYARSYNDVGGALSTHRMSALAAGTSLAIATATGGTAGAADDPGTSDPWVTLTEDGYHRFAVPHSAVREVLGAEPVTVEISGTFGPAGTWADLATELQGGEHVASPLLAPGLHVFTYTATLVDRTRVTFREPTQPQPVTSDDTLATIFVAGEGVDWFADSPEPGPVEEVTYRVGESDRTAFVWRPHGVSGALPTLFLLADEAHSAREWLELGRAAQVLDRLHTDGGLTPMQVVM